MKPKDRIQEIVEEIRKLLKKESNPKKLKNLEKELKELLVKKRVDPTSFYETDSENKSPKKPKSLRQILYANRRKLLKKK